MDQNPHKPNFELVQGLVTLTPSREKDGGLTLIKGSHNLVKKFFEETGGIKDEQDSGVGRNGYVLNPHSPFRFVFVHKVIKI